MGSTRVILIVSDPISLTPLAFPFVSYGDVTEFLLNNIGP